MLNNNDLTQTQVESSLKYKFSLKISLDKIKKIIKKLGENKI